VSPTALSAVVLAPLALSLFAGVRLAFAPGATDRLPLAIRDERTGRRFGYGLCWATLVAALWAGVSGTLPPSVPAVVSAVPVGVALAARVAPGSAVPVARYGAWVALPALGGAVAFAPLSTPLPDISVFGRYTYLATEVAFGGVALALLVRAGRDALRSTALTVAVVYPTAYVWDWYTLTVGVFSVPLRTGHEFVGIPVEEHLFMIVVPGFVLAVHETLRAARAD